jgi:3-oxo-4,17-pregnadiene-20-carboxyl-CoA hydratase beta subunit
VSEVLHFDDVRVGDELPELRIEITPTLVIAGALASRDLTRVHHDKAEAQRRGLRDVIMNTMTTNGLVSRFISDWGGPDAVLRRVTLKLGAPNLPGDAMTLSGRVEETDAARGEVGLSVVGKNAWGNHVTGSARVALPRRGQA